MIRRLGAADLEAVCALVARVVAGMRQAGIDQWDEGYPDRARLAAFSRNPRALSLYEQNGYTLRGRVNFRKGVFHCYEKPLPAGDPGRG